MPYSFYRQRTSLKLFAIAMLSSVATFVSNFAYAGTGCENLPAISLESAKVVSSLPITATSYIASDGITYMDVPPFCKVTIVATPSSDSLVNIELWLPTNWNGRFQGIGNGGYAGSTAAGAPAMIAALKQGFAVATTDMGTAPSTTNNADALVGHPEKWRDWGGRATHFMTTLSKQLIQTHYDQAPVYSYFNGCSTGGQQALMSAQRYPADYDGILAGSPANNRTHIHTSAIWNYKAMHATATSMFTSAQTNLITNSVVAACAAKSGGLATDAFLTDPRTCDWDPGVLQCSALIGTNCLTADQVKAARAIYDGVRNPATGKVIVPGGAKGAESDPQFGWFGQQKGIEPSYDSLFKWVFGATWLWQTFDFNQDMASVDSLLAPMLNANSADLSQFKSRGGKLLHYHGWADPLIVPQESINYYNRVVNTQSPAGGAVALRKTQEFYRLFMVPGMYHCAGGPGPNAFGNLFSGTVIAPPPLANDRANDAMVALQQWVEKGVSPDRLIATKYTQDQPALGVQMTRPICAFPKIPKYSGSGPTNDASSFVCVDSMSTNNPTAASEYLR